ncbi:MAG: hypothetical protein R2712_19890 [Vicinamibacterales bacterium]
MNRGWCRQWRRAALAARELRGHEEGLREEPLNLAGAGHGAPVFLGQLVDAEDGDDVLQVLVALQDLLHLARDVVVLVADDARIQDARAGRQRVHGGVDAELRDLARQVGRRVEVREGGGRRRVRVVVGGHVDGLHRGDGPLLGRGDALLQLAHLGEQGRLVADGGGHAAQERRHLGARLREAEDVVDEQQNVLALGVTEMLATVSADSPTRWRAPGGSVICP